MQCEGNFVCIKQETKLAPEIYSVKKPEKVSNNLDKTPDEKIEKSGHLLALSKYAPITKENDSLGLFNELSPGLREYLNKIYLIDGKDFMAEGVEGHTHKNLGEICIDKQKFTFKKFSHETAHVRHEILDTLKSGLSEKWESVANFKYGTHGIYPFNYELWEDGTEDPKNGMLTPYSARSISEDIAEFVEISSENFLFPESIRKKNSGKLSRSFIKKMPLLYPLYFANPEDLRYKKKLDLLREYNFFTEDRYKTLSERLGSLYYLLKENGKRK